MNYLLCRNRVVDFPRWKAVFSSHGQAHRNAGLRLVRIWRAAGDPDNVFFLFEAAGTERARAFIDDPEGAKAGERAGVIEGEYFFLDDAGGY